MPGDDILEPINALIALAKDAGAKLLFDAAKLTKYEHVKLLAQASSKLLVCLEPAKQLKVVSGSGSSSSSDIDELTVDASAAVKMTHAARAVRMAQTDVAQRIQSGEASEEDAADFVRELTQQAPKKATKGAAAAATSCKQSGRRGRSWRGGNVCPRRVLFAPERDRTARLLRRAAAAQRNFRALPWFENLVPPRGTRGDGDLDRQEEGPRAGWITSLPCSRTTSKCRLNAKSKDI